MPTEFKNIPPGPNEGGPVIINPAGDVPANYGPGRARWRISPESAGLLERICRARFDVQQLLPGVSDVWQEVQAQSQNLTGPMGAQSLNLRTTDEVIGTIAQSVYASTKIEGEEVFAKDVPLAIVGQADQRQSVQDDYSARMTGAQDTYKAYIWALGQADPLPGGGVVNPEFLLHLHQLMFSRTKPGQAGKFKTENNQIQSGGAAILTMLPHDRVPECIARLCDRLNSQFLIADNSGRYSKLLAVGEFVLDFLAIHPFADGNGRASRLLSTYLLERAGFHFARFYSLDSVLLDRQTEYYQVLFHSQKDWYAEKEDLTPWIEFYLSSIYSQWLRAHEEILRHKANGKAMPH